MEYHDRQDEHCQATQRLTGGNPAEGWLHPYSLSGKMLLYGGASTLVLVLTVLAYVLFVHNHWFDADLFGSSPGVKKQTDGPSKSGVGSDKPLLKPLREPGVMQKTFPRSAKGEHGATGERGVVDGLLAVTFPLVGDQRTQALDGGNKPTGLPAGEEEYPSASSLDIINRQLHLVESQQKAYELALQLMQSRPGAFSGFFPERTMPGASYVKNFEAKIVELEMQRKSLAVRFKPASRELQSVNQEIAGIRDAMKEYISEQLVFLQKRRETLLSEKTRLERKVGKSRPTRDTAKVNWLLDELKAGVEDEPAASGSSPHDPNGALRVQTGGDNNDRRSSLVSGLNRLAAAGKAMLQSLALAGCLEGHVAPSAEKDSWARNVVLRLVTAVSGVWTGDTSACQGRGPATTTSIGWVK